MGEITDQVINRRKDELESHLRRLFKNKFSCYADTNREQLDDGPVVLAMDEDRFVEVVTELLMQTFDGIGEIVNKQGTMLFNNQQKLEDIKEAVRLIKSQSRN